MPTYKISDQLGYPEDLLEFANPGNVALPGTFLYPVYENGSTFTYNIEAYDLDPAEVEVLCDATLISYSCNCEGYQASQSSSTSVQITGIPTGVFQSKYKFITLQDTIEFLPSTTTEYKELIQWMPPSESLTTITHKITVLVNSTTIPQYVANTVTFNINQEVRWRWQIDLEVFKKLLNRS